MATLAEIAFGSFLIAVGLFVLYMLGGKYRGKYVPMLGMGLSLVIGIGGVIAGGWFLFRGLPVEFLTIKALGFVLFGFGFFLLFYFPASYSGTVPRYQVAEMTRTAFFFGLVLFLIGAYILLFYR